MRTDACWRHLLQQSGIPQPSDALLISEIRWLARDNEFWLRSETGQWLWFDQRTGEWKSAPLGPPY